MTETRAEAMAGVRGLPRLAAGCGMLFPFGSPGRHAMTMRGVGFPLDMVWLDAKLCVASVAYRVPPGTSLVWGHGAYVLELGSGQALLLSVVPGFCLVPR